MSFAQLRLVAALAAGLVLSGAVAPADAAPTRYDEAYVFGDSLSDPGNLFALLGGLPGCPEPICPYFEGRYSNGPVWADYLAADFAASGQTFSNYAYGFARVVTPTTVDPTEPGTLLPINLDNQIGQFLLETGGSVGPRSVGIVWMGANDAFGIINQTLAAIGATPTEEANLLLQAANAAASVAGNLSLAMQTVAGTGLRDLVLLNLPNLGKAPLYSANAAFSAVASLVSGSFNAALAAQNFDGLNVTRIDIAGLFDALMEDPASFGVSNLLACFNQFDPAAGLCTDPDERAFFDLVHPNRIIHARIADEVRTVVAPVPLPAAAWLLLAGLGSLVVLHRRTA